MFAVISLISLSIFLSYKNKLYFFCILPILLFFNYLFFYIVTNTNFIDNEFLDRYIEAYNLKLDGNIDFQLLNKITNSITFFFIQIILFTYIFQKTKIIKKLSIKLLNALNQTFFKLNFNESSLSKYKRQKNKLNLFETLLLIVIVAHAISFYTSDFLIYHKEYLFINKEEYYYLYPKISKILVRSLNSVLNIFFISRIFKSGTNFFKDPINCLVFLHAIIIYLSINSRWVFVYIFCFTIYFSVKIYLDSQNKISRKLYSLLIFISGSYLSILTFSKSLFFRSRLQGLGTIFFTFNDIEFGFSSIINVLSSFLSSLLVIYSGVDQDIKTSLNYDIFSLVPIPSYILQINTTILEQVSRVSVYAPSPLFVQVYQSNYFYGLIIVILISFVLSILSYQRKLLTKLKKERYKILEFYPNAYELLITLILYVGFQYYSRTVMTYFWWLFLFLIIIPLSVNTFFINEKKSLSK